MDLEVLIKKYPGIELATNSDNGDILKFFDSTAMDTDDGDIRYERSPDFFRFLDYRAPHNLTLIYRNPDHLLTGVATFSFRKGYINKKLESVGYLGDLRLALDRSLIKQWRHCYNEILENSHSIDQFQGCKNFLTAVMDKNKRAGRALVNPKKANFRYDPLSKYEMINILGRYRKIGLKFIEVHQAMPIEKEEILDFLETQNRKKEFGCTKVEILRRLDVWENFSLKSFLIARKGRKIVGVVAPWMFSEAKRIIPNKLPKALIYLKKFVHRLPVKFKFVRIPDVDQPLSILYLTHLEISDSDYDETFRALLNATYENYPRNWNMISFPRFSKKKPVLMGYIYNAIPMGLYSVRGLKADEPSYAYSPCFEMAIV